ncbi:Uncharacterized protein TCAP_05015 [Tolypocladium capitatum]|uniref:HAUS augmin-like complex subunit 4 n=1 Tax=Tolypocladium capitatum TaxID=45235 RepID=A0A2K3QBW8_9HYPO|nr:Uncharacterized protein TCAP_05015 [Tolypocladium capitatum]
MLPPVDDQVLQDNPDFAKLYSTLVNVVLNPDGSSQHDSGSEQCAAVQKEINKYRLRTARHHLLERAVATASPPESKPTISRSLNQPGQRLREPSATELPEPLLDLLLILPPLLEAERSLSPDSTALLLSSPPLCELESLLAELATLVSTNLHSSALSLVRLLHPTTNSSYLHRHISSLPTDYSALLDNFSTAQKSLIAVRLRALTFLTDLLHSYTQSLTHLVRSLEAKHGVIARSLELRASHVSLQAQGTELDASNALCNRRKEVYSPQAVAALQNYAAHLKDAKVRAAERLHGLQAELGEYGVGTDGGEGKEKVMREMARVYREMGKQMEDVRKDLYHLQGG